MADVQEFIKFYNQAYYLSEEKPVIKGLRRTDKCIEGEIDTLLETGIRDKQDILKILCWKTGGKRMEDDYSVKTSRSTITVNDQFVDFVAGSNVTADDDALNALKTIMDVPYIGFTYAVTLLYFMSKGRYPIYDKFAHIALMMIYDESPFDHIIVDSELKRAVPSDINKKASNKDKKIEEAFEKYKENYIGRIKRIFEGVKTNSERDIDRALWVYGHLFNDNERNRRRVKYLK